MQIAEAQVSSLSKTYARSLFELAQEAGALDEVASQLMQLRELAAAEPDLGRLLGNRLLSVEERAEIIDLLFKDQLHDVLYRFLQVVNRKSRLDELPGIIAAFDELMDQHAGRIEVDAYVATELGDEQRATVAERVGKALGKTVELREHVQKSLIGGLKLRVGDRLIDGSVATRLRLLRRQLVDQGQEAARQLKGLEE